MISNGFDGIKRIGYHDGKPIEKFVEFLLSGCEAIAIGSGDDEYFLYALTDERRAK